MAKLTRPVLHSPIRESVRDRFDPSGRQISTDTLNSCNCTIASFPSPKR